MTILKKRKGSLDLPSAVLSIISMTLSAITAINIDNIISLLLSFPRITSIIISLLGLVLYWFRSRYRAQYGMIEVVFGAFSIYGFLTGVTSTTQIDYAATLPILGSLYIIVRGMDNICSSINEIEDTLPSRLIKFLYWLKNEQSSNNDEEVAKKSHGI